MKRVLAARQDNNGDVLLCGPALRAIARRAGVTLLCSPAGEAAARLLPGVDRVIVRQAEWIDAHPKRVEANDTAAFIAGVRGGAFDEAVIFTSFHQSPLPLALLLRMAGVPRIGAISTDYPGSLLDVRHTVEDDIHEVRRALSLANAMGYELDSGDDARLRITGSGERASELPPKPYIVVHPGATVAARAWYPNRNADLVKSLAARGRCVVVTGSREERALTQFVAGSSARDLGGSTTFSEFAEVLGNAAAVICGNTAAAHLAAAVGTPVVAIFPPTIPFVRFSPWMVRYAVLGDQQAPCAGCRARSCPIEGQPCLDGVGVDDVMRALDALVPQEARAA
ncbi:MAG: glycosyltransferase family 9 protein [Candidatus Baltobacteraceae bacterium]